MIASSYLSCAELVLVHPRMVESHWYQLISVLFPQVAEGTIFQARQSAVFRHWVTQSLVCAAQHCALPSDPHFACGSTGDNA